MALGRISGEMLEQNLNLTGNLTFNGDTLTIASDGKIGIKNTTPGVELDVTGTARANTVTVLGDLSMEWTITMDAQDNLNFAYNGNTLITYDNNGNISGTVATELELLTDVDVTTNTPTTTSGLVLTSDGDSSYSFQNSINISGAITANSLQSYRMQEYVDIISVSTSFVNANVSANGTVIFMTVNMAAATTVNVRGDASTTFDSLVAVNETVTVVFMFTNGATAYINNVFQIDGAPQTVKWNGGSAPTAGTANAIDVYSYTIIKTAANTYTVLGSFSSFA